VCNFGSTIGVAPVFGIADYRARLVIRVASGECFFQPSFGMGFKAEASKAAP
jgi:hypothetical protein